MEREDLFNDLEDIFVNLQDAYISVTAAVELITDTFEGAKEFGGDLSKALADSIAVRKSVVELEQSVADVVNKIYRENK